MENYTGEVETKTRHNFSFESSSPVSGYFSFRPSMSISGKLYSSPTSATHTRDSFIFLTRGGFNK